MNRLAKIDSIRAKIQRQEASIGTWMQIPHPSIAEIIGASGFDWVAVDLEHGSICENQLPDIFRALELGDTLPMVRLAQGTAKECKQSLDAGAGGVIVPMVNDAEQLGEVSSACRWPPSGIRGVGFSRANLFGKYFDQYKAEAQSPLMVAMIENIQAIDNLEDILKVPNLDAIFIGPYDLSASMKMIGEFESEEFRRVLKHIHSLARKQSIACGMHVVMPDKEQLIKCIDEGNHFVAYSIDSVFLAHAAELDL